MIRGGSSVLALVLWAGPVLADEATVAVAANFLTTAEELAALYEYETGHEIVVAHGSTGRLYAQIVNGAPFDVFLAADAARPAALEAAGLTDARTVYALGRLVLVSREPFATEAELGPLVAGRRVALADPAVAPYGAAALEALGAAGADPATLEIVYGDSVGQVAALFSTGNADLAFLALSQVPLLDAGVSVRDLEGLYAPIRQDAVLLSRAAGNVAARGFFDFLGGETAVRTIREAGYGVPE